MKPSPSVAIVGVGGIFPGAADVEQFWAAILRGSDAVREVPEGRWLLSQEEAYDPRIAWPDKLYSRRGCFIEELPRLSPGQLDISPELLSNLDPMFRLLLYAGSQAFNDAVVASLDRKKVGVIIGNLALPSESSSALAREYLGRSLEEKVLGQSRITGVSATHPLNRYVAGLPAGVLAKALGLGGGAMSLDAACSSSLYALKLAVDDLKAGRVDAMLAGGLSRPDCFYTQMGFSQLRALSISGTCSPFDEQGDGLVVGEGSGMLLLKRTEDAIRDEDHIYAVIRGIGLSNDIGGSLLAPMSEGQLRAMRAAYAEAGITPQDIDHIECHATGTPVGDAVEVESLRALWGAEHWEPEQCVIGSVKSNVGHLLTAAGSAALIKTLLALKHKTLPPTANFSRAAQGVGLDDSPFHVLQTAKPWAERDSATPRRAAVSAFGFGGINAHVVLEDFEAPEAAELVTPEVETFEPPSAIAVVGMDASFGPWTSLCAFQERVLGGGSEVEPQAPHRWWGAEESAWFRLQGLGRFPFKGHFIDRVEIPVDRFRIPPKELAEMLPQQLLMLQVAANALNDAGLDAAAEESGASADLTRTGVYVGIGLDLNTTNFSFRWSLQPKARKWADQLGLQLSAKELDEWTASLRDAAGPPLTANRTMGALGSVVASRIAREFRAGGPSFTVSSEESSGIRALEVAVRALQDGSISQAIVGAVDLAGDLRSVLATHRGRGFSSTGYSRPFDEKADGAVIGEGAAAVVLKPLEQAQREGDRIYAVIRGMGVTTGGGVESQVPEEGAYVTAARKAYAEAGVDIGTVGYVEAHGSACPEEDRMEARGLARLFKTRDNRVCTIGTAKADVGHTGAASGLAGLVKACLSLYQEILPPLRNFAHPLAELSVTGHRLNPSPHPQFWLGNREEGPHRAGLSAFSLDGNCTHVVLESYEHETEPAVQAERLQPLGARQEGLFFVEANNVPALEVALGRLHAHIEHSPEEIIESLARRWWRENREDASKSLAVTCVARNGPELLDQIEFVRRTLDQRPDRALTGKESGSIPPYVRDRVFFSPEPTGREGKIAFVYPGSGNQYMGMGRDLSVQWPEVFRKQDAENEYLLSQFQPEVFWNAESLSSINQNHKAALFGQVALGTATTDLIQSFGLQPSAVIGYSLGETAGLFALKAWIDRDLMLRRINESTLFTEDLAGEYKAARKVWKVPSNKTVDWALGVIDRPAKVARAALKDHKKVYSLIANTLHECVVGGDPHAVEKIVKKLDCEFFPLHGVTTVHCEVAKEVQKPYRELHVLETNPPKDIRFYSGAWGTAYNVSKESAADSVLAQAIYGIDYPKVIEAAYEDGARLFIEMGPGASCARMIGEILTDRPHMARSVCCQGQEGVSTVLRTLAHLIAERVSVDLSVLYGQETHVIDHNPGVHPSNLLSVPVGGEAFSIVLPERKSPTREVPASAPPTDVWRNPIPDSVPTLGPFVEWPAILPAVATRTASSQPAAPADSFVQQWINVETQKAQAHESYLRFSESTTKALSDALSLQLSMIESITYSGDDTIEAPSEKPSQTPLSDSPESSDPPAFWAPPLPNEIPSALNREQCLEFAIGSIAQVFGKNFALVDRHPTRVRLPDEPLMLVDRVLSFQGEPCSLSSGGVVTEHDILPGSWYLDGGRIPTCIAVEAGQADLILSAYLGIDFETRGNAMYRLLDAVVTFHGSLPSPGDTIHYDIRIARFFRQGDTHLFRFNFDATVNGEPVLTMRDGCAGFFTREELDAGRGIVQTEIARQRTPSTRPAEWSDLVPMAVESYDDAQLTALRNGDLAGCFGPLFANLGLQNPVRLPGGRMKLVDRIFELDPDGGRFGLGQIRGEMDIFPDDWFLTCHFVDDRVMPGTLMYECCLHTLRIYLMRVGWVGEADRVVYEPVPGVASQLKCRGEVNESTKKVIYEIVIKELGYNPSPYAIADTLIYVDGRPVIEMNNLSLQLTGLTGEEVEQRWHHREIGELRRAAPLFDQASIRAFAVGNPSEAFGDRYKAFDSERVIARLPGPPYQFLERVTRVDGHQWVMQAGGTITTEYDVPEEAWYFDANRQRTMPFAVLLEIALQPCGWFAAYMGSALTSETDLHFRNLGGNATQYANVTPELGTLSVDVKCTKVSSSAGMIIQNYEYTVRTRQEVVYAGDTYFGFFSAAALENQVGLGADKLYQPSQAELSVSVPFDYPSEAPYPNTIWRMVDRIDVFDPKGGKNGLGFIRGSIQVDPDAWFFKAHFYQDPVWPGSLGLEAFLQILKLIAVDRWAVGGEPQLEAVALDEPHSWTYRGQVLPVDKVVSVEATVMRIDDQDQRIHAEGHLTVDGRVIYEINNFAVRLTEEIR